jgi:hypothetical protein
MIDLPRMMTMEAKISEEDFSALSQQSPQSRKQSFDRAKRLNKAI